MKTDLFHFCGYCWVFQICWHIECHTLTASSFRIWHSSAGIPPIPSKACCPYLIQAPIPHTVTSLPSPPLTPLLHLAPFHGFGIELRKKKGRKNGRGEGWTEGGSKEESFLFIYFFKEGYRRIWASLVAQLVKPAFNSGDLGSIPGLGRFPREGNGNPLQYAYLENPMDRGDWQTRVHGVARIRHDLATKPP